MKEQKKNKQMPWHCKRERERYTLVKQRGSWGITLIALIITIIVLLILAGVTIASLTGKNGILKNVERAEKASKDSQSEEQEKLNELDDLIARYTKTEKTEATTKYYMSLLDAINDANQDIITNGKEDATGAKAKIELDKNNNVYVSPLEDANLDTVVQVGSKKGYTLDLNDKTLTFSENNHFDQLANTKLILDDSGTKGNVTKTTSASANQYIIKSSGELALNGGTYTLNNSGEGHSCSFRMENATFITNGGTILATHDGTGYTESMAKSIQITGKSLTTIYDVTCRAKSADGIADAFYMSGKDESGENSSITINGGEFTALSEQNECDGVYFKGTIGKVTINGGEFYADGKNYHGYGINVHSTGNVTINNGNFIADGNLITSEKDTSGVALYSNSDKLVINGGYFRGNRTGANITNKGYITGGTFESPNNGGMCLSGDVSVKNAIIKLGTYKGKYAAEIANIEHYGIFYIGSESAEARVYMDHVTLESDFENKRAVVTSNYNAKDSYLYVSNTTFPGPIRVDGTRSNSQNPTAQGHLYVGKNVSYSGITTGSGSTKGVVDTTTYADTEFLQE